jgi:hypothetical protein
MKTSTENKWIATILIVATAIAAIIIIEGGEKPKTLPKQDTNQTAHVLPMVSDMPTNPSPLSF